MSLYICTAYMLSALLGHRRVLDVLELELQIAVSHLMFVLEIKAKSSKNSFNHSKPSLVCESKNLGEGEHARTS